MPNSADRRTDREARSGIPLGALCDVEALLSLVSWCHYWDLHNHTFRASFDFDPLNLRNPDTESVATLFDLMTDVRQSPYTISILVKNETQAEFAGN